MSVPTWQLLAQVAKLHEMQRALQQGGSAASSNDETAEVVELPGRARVQPLAPAG